MARIARPASLAIWHRGRSHRRPNRSGSPKRRHFASLDRKKHADFSHRRPTSQDFCRRFFCHFPVISDQANVLSHRDEKITSLAIWVMRDSNRIAHRGRIARDLGHITLTTRGRTGRERGTTRNFLHLFPLSHSPGRPVILGMDFWVDLLMCAFRIPAQDPLKLHLLLGRD